MFTISILTIVYGCFNGPFLTATAIIVTTTMPFVVSEFSGAVQIFFYYLALVAVAGLLIDRFRRCAWVSVLALFATQAAPLAVSMASVGDVQYLVFAMITAAAAIAIPPCQLFLKHEGSIVTETFQGRLRALNWPEFLNRIAFGGYLGAIIISVLVVLKDAVWLRFGPPSQRAQHCTRWPTYKPRRASVVRSCPKGTKRLYPSCGIPR